MPEPGPDTGDVHVPQPASGPDADETRTTKPVPGPDTGDSTYDSPRPASGLGADEKTTSEIIQLVLPMSVTAWCALVNGLTRVYPHATVIDGPPDRATLRLGDPRPDDL